MLERLDAIVVGAGVIGLAVARALARAGHETVVLDAERAIGQHQSSRNSEVVHAGLYYPPGSLKARLCVPGRKRLDAYCRRRGIAHRRCGKLVVATGPRERAVLDRIAATARDNGVDDLEILDAAAVRRLEPCVRADAALLSPSTGIVDSDGLLRALRRDAHERDAVLALGTAFASARVVADGFEVRAGDATVHCRRLVVAAGIGAQTAARAIEGLPPAAIPPRHLAKGSYFRIDARPFSRLVYPVPDTASLGIHVTLDLSGGVRFGPDQQWVDTIDYAVDPARAPAFAAAIRRYYPALPDDALQPDYAGVRVKIQGPGEPPVDWRIDGPEAHGVAGLVCLFGIESPGLTACLPIADAVLARLGITPPPED